MKELKTRLLQESDIDDLEFTDEDFKRLGINGIDHISETVSMSWSNFIELFNDTVRFNVLVILLEYAKSDDEKLNKLSYKINDWTEGYLKLGHTDLREIIDLCLAKIEKEIN